MLKIRADQMVAFENAQEQRFIGEFLLFLETFGLENGIPTGHATRDVVRSAIIRAVQYGLSTREQLTSFLLAALLISSEFSEFPHVQEILQDRMRPPTQRLEAVFAGLDEEDWEIVAAYKNHG